MSGKLNYELGSSFYNKGLDDAQKVVIERMDSIKEAIDEQCYFE